MPSLYKLMDAQRYRLEALSEYQQLRSETQTLLTSSPFLPDSSDEQRLWRYVRQFLGTVLGGSATSVRVDSDELDRGFKAVLRYLRDGAIEVEGCAPLLYYRGEHDPFEVEGGLTLRPILPSR
jgi:hypothetical protein